MNDNPNSSTSSPDMLMCVLSYLGILALVPFFVKKDDPFISWHARQGVLLFVVCFIAYLVLFVFSLVPFFGLLTLPLYLLLFVAIVAVSIYCIVQACQGKKWPIPILSQFLDKVPSPK